MKKLMVALALALPLAATAAEPSTTGKSGPTAPATAVVKGTGVVKGAYDPSWGRIILAHDAIPAVKWPAMVMSFRISADLAKGLKEGQKVEFEFQPRDMDGTITRVKVLP